MEDHRGPVATKAGARTLIEQEPCVLPRIEVSLFTARPSVLGSPKLWSLPEIELSICLSVYLTVCLPSVYENLTLTQGDLISRPLMQSAKTLLRFHA
jgi:hypothetical protein